MWTANFAITEALLNASPTSVRRNTAVDQGQSKTLKIPRTRRKRIQLSYHILRYMVRRTRAEAYMMFRGCIDAIEEKDCMYREGEMKAEQISRTETARRLSVLSRWMLAILLIYLIGL